MSLYVMLDGKDGFSMVNMYTHRQCLLGILPYIFYGLRCVYGKDKEFMA